MTLINTQKKTNTKIHKFNPHQIKSQVQQITHPSTENQSNTIPGNQPNIYDINIQCQELNKGMHIAKTLKGKLNNKHKTNISWLVTTIKAILKTPNQKL